MLGIVAKGQPDFAHGGINAAIDIDEDILFPELRRDLVARNQVALSLDQEKKQFHRQLLQAKATVPALQPVLRLIQFVFAEMEFLRRRHLT